MRIVIRDATESSRPRGRQRALPPARNVISKEDRRNFSS
jgi:hypothetical protein